ncbi:nitroreductase family protein [Herminiimonas contaminans]|uniref:Nitroreductase n=1 Tax=Herminiimonas contaminans TaxID=1111140 RepID=A0ABS0EU39_9BURK|nr:nitroreductase [Herminiimonas contaminans]MBF8178359.1 nitroreductase [Herminiimonas contaminans]
MELFDAIKNRRAVREYTTENVDKESIRKLIDAAIHAPSAVNNQPWTFTVVRDKEKLDELSVQAKAYMLRSISDDPGAAHFRKQLEDRDFHLFYHAPVLLVISSAEMEKWANEDCALAAQNMMLAAHGSGLGSCWIGLAQHYLNTAAGKALLNLPIEWLTVAPIIIGHPSHKASATSRKDAVIYWIDPN